MLSSGVLRNLLSKVERVRVEMAFDLCLTDISYVDYRLENSQGLGK